MIQDNLFISKSLMTPAKNFFLNKVIFTYLRDEDLISLRPPFIPPHLIPLMSVVYDNIPCFIPDVSNLCPLFFFFFLTYLGLEQLLELVSLSLVKFWMFSDLVSLSIFQPCLSLLPLLLILQ